MLFWNLCIIFYLTYSTMVKWNKKMFEETKEKEKSNASLVDIISILFFQDYSNLGNALYNTSFQFLNIHRKKKKGKILKIFFCFQLAAGLFISLWWDESLLFLFLRFQNDNYIKQETLVKGPFLISSIKPRELIT